MMDTRADDNAVVMPKRANGYLSNGGTPQNAGFVDMRIPGAAGALISTVGDLYKWDRALASGKLLKPEPAARMWTVEKNNYAYGWSVFTREGKTVQGHGGGINGFSSFIERVLGDGVAVIVLSNFEDGQVGAVKDGLMKIVYGLPAEFPTVRTEIQLDSALLDEYIGTYEISPTFSLVVTRVGEQIITQAKGQGKLPIFAEAKDLFFPKAIPATITFTRDEGKVTGLILKQDGREMKAKRR